MGRKVLPGEEQWVGKNMDIFSPIPTVLKLEAYDLVHRTRLIQGIQV